MLSARSNRTLLARLCAGIAALLLATSTPAATQGGAGTTSSGSVDITLTTGLAARLSGLVDFALGTWSGSGDLAADQDVCIGRSGVPFFGLGAYRIRAYGDGDPADVSAFTLSNGVDRLYYDVWFNDQTGLGGRQSLTAGVMQSGLQGFGFGEVLNWLFGCVVRNANVSISVPVTQMQAAVGGTYSGTLTLVLIPD